MKPKEVQRRGALASWSVFGMLAFALALVTVLWPVVEPIFNGNRLMAGAACFWFLFGIMIVGDIVAGPGHTVKGKWHAYVWFAFLSVALVYMAVPGLFSRPSAPGLVAHNTQSLMLATAQVAPTAVPTVAPPPTLQPAQIAHPETNGADVGVVAVQELGKAVEREQRQNEVLAQRPSADLLIVALVIIGILVVVLVIVAGGQRNRRNDAQPDPGFHIQAPTTPAQLKPGDWFEVNGKLFQVPELPAANTQKQIGKRR